MQFTQLASENRNLITAYGDGYVTVNGVRHEQSLIVRPNTLQTDWPVPAIQQLKFEDLGALADSPMEILLLGTGVQQCFPEKALWRRLRKTFQGLEIMHTEAACRTYNLIASEGRDVVAALILETTRGRDQSRTR